MFQPPRRVITAFTLKFARFLFKGSSDMSDNLFSQQNTPSDRRRSQPSRSDSARAQQRSLNSHRFSLPTRFPELDHVTTSQGSQLDQYDSVTIDASSLISERKRRRKGKQKRGSARPAGPGRGHKTIFGETIFQVFSLFFMCFKIPFSIRLLLN